MRTSFSDLNSLVSLRKSDISIGRIDWQNGKVSRMGLIPWIKTNTGPRYAVLLRKGTGKLVDLVLTNGSEEHLFEDVIENFSSLSGDVFGSLDPKKLDRSRTLRRGDSIEILYFLGEHSLEYMTDISEKFRLSHEEGNVQLLWLTSDELKGIAKGTQTFLCTEIFSIDTGLYSMLLEFPEAF